MKGYSTEFGYMGYVDGEYMQFNDEDKTLVTVIYEPANATHSIHVNVVPCQISLKEIRKLN